MEGRMEGRMEGLMEGPRTRPGFEASAAAARVRAELPQGRAA